MQSHDKSWSVQLPDGAGGTRCPICKRQDGDHEPECIVGLAWNDDAKAIYDLALWCEEFVNDSEHGKFICRICNAYHYAYKTNLHDWHRDWCWVGKELTGNGGEE